MLKKNWILALVLCICFAILPLRAEAKVLTLTEKDVLSSIHISAEARSSAVKLNGIFVADNGKIYGFKNGELCFGLTRLKLSSGQYATYYFQTDGSAYTKGLYYLNGSTYFFGTDGKAYEKGFKDVSGARYYFGNGGKAAKSTLLEVPNGSSKSYYYFDSNAKMFKGGLYRVSVYTVADSNYNMTRSSDNTVNTYYFAKNGKAFRKGILKYRTGQNTYYSYFNKKGRMVKNKLVNTRAYYEVKSDGSIANKKTKYEYSYYLTSDGRAYTSGHLKVGKGKYYYFDTNARALKNTYKKATKIAEVKNGKVIVRSASTSYYYYLTATGKAFTGGLKHFTKDGKKRTAYFTNSGKAVMRKWVTVKGKKYYFTSNGYAATGKKKVDGKYHYFDENGVFIK